MNQKIFPVFNCNKKADGNSLFSVIGKLRIVLILAYSFIHQFIFTKKITSLTQIPKIIKYYFAAGIASGIISGSIHGKNNDYQKRYALLFSYWAVLLIILDQYTDLHKGKQHQGSQVNILVARQIFDRLSVENFPISSNLQIKFGFWLEKHGFPEDNISFEPIDSISFASKMFTDNLVKCLNTIPESNVSVRRTNVLIVITLLMRLMDAQINSLKQGASSDGYDWKWYSKTTLENKFNYVFSSMLYVFPQNRIQHRRIKKLISGIEKINRLFFHRQILDDFIDFEEDINANILATPSYILMEIDKNTVSTDVNADDLCDILKRKIEIANSYQIGSFSKAWKNSDKLSCISIIKSVLIRPFIDAIEDKSRIQQIFSKISIIAQEEVSIEGCLSLYYFRCLRSYMNFRNRFR